MTKIFFITRTYPPYEDTGPSLIRYSLAQVFQENKIKVKIIRISTQDFTIINYLPKLKKVINFFELKFLSILEKIGIISDYLMPYVFIQYFKLRNKIKKNEIIFSTTGGELGTVILGDMLKRYSGAKHFIHFRDPINYGVNLGVRRNNKFHVGRSVKQIKLMKKADLLIFTSINHAKKIKQLNLKTKQIVQYSGYISDKHQTKYNRLIKKKNHIPKERSSNQIESRLKKIKKKFPDSKIIFYGGSTTSTHNIQKFLKVIKLFPQNKVNMFIFTNSDLKNFNKYDNIFIEKYVPSKLYTKLIKNYADAGVIAMHGKYRENCLSAKIFDFIKLKKYIIGYHTLKSEINLAIKKYGYGTTIPNDVNKFNQKKELSKVLKKISIKNHKKFTSNNWSMPKMNNKLLTLIKD